MSTAASHATCTKIVTVDKFAALLCIAHFDHIFLRGGTTNIADIAMYALFFANLFPTTTSGVTWAVIVAVFKIWALLVVARLGLHLFVFGTTFVTKSTVNALSVASFMSLAAGFGT